eukprot:gnl/MRDRNA2_/MRDRNA2_56254_c0_seq1.p1 gnl/MRDRNA2_/MRDRNA2_56254_c0~~gnl/MRDRNA2_/MRDRNA2_56254_c0_seq1.p1  ORF type:complete len:237 (-),score=32.91 gnl/MRDRNA2_/MRDRNA2_56254_c0_seq1:10-720(-)
MRLNSGRMLVLVVFVAIVNCIAAQMATSDESDNIKCKFSEESITRGCQCADCQSTDASFMFTFNKLVHGGNQRICDCIHLCHRQSNCHRIWLTKDGCSLYSKAADFTASRSIHESVCWMKAESEITSDRDDPHDWHGVAIQNPKSSILGATIAAASILVVCCMLYVGGRELSRPFLRNWRDDPANPRDARVTTSLTQAVAPIEVTESPVLDVTVTSETSEVLPRAVGREDQEISSI